MYAHPAISGRGSFRFLAGERTYRRHTAIYSPGVFFRRQEFAWTIWPGNPRVSLPAPIIEWTIGSGAVANDPRLLSIKPWTRRTTDDRRQFRWWYGIIRARREGKSEEEMLRERKREREQPVEPRRGIRPGLGLRPFFSVRVAASRGFLSHNVFRTSFSHIWT